MLNLYKIELLVANLLNVILFTYSRRFVEIRQATILESEFYENANSHDIFSVYIYVIM